MIYDLLSALQGFPGGLFRIDQDALRFRKFVRTESNLFLSNGEVDQVNQILEIASDRFAIRQFCTDPDAYSKAFSDEFHQMLYLNAVKDGMRKAISDSYDLALINLETDILKGGNESIMRVTTVVKEWQYALHIARSMVEEILNGAKKHAAIFDCLYQKYSAHSAKEQNTHKVLSLCVGQFEYVLFHHLAKWLTNGVTSSSFFVNKQEDGKFSLDINTLPLQISAVSANKILFIGTWTNTLRQRVSELGAESDFQQLSDDFVELLQKLRLEKGEMDELRLVTLSPTRMNWRAFSGVIEEAEQRIMRFIWQTCLKDGHLIAALRDLRDVFFLNRGDLYLSLYETIEENYNHKSTPSRFDLTRKWNAISWACGFDKAENRFAIQTEKKVIPTGNGILEEPYVTPHEDLGLWPRLYLNYELNDYMSLFLTKEHIRKYGVIFRLLNRVRNCHIRMEGMSCLRNTDEQFAICRFKMIGWLNVVEDYFHIEVISNEWKTLHDTFDSKDVSKFTSTHEKYLLAIAKKCFLVQRALLNSFLAVVEVCEEFAKSSDLGCLAEFNQKSRFFFDLIAKMNGDKSESHLASLTLGLNFNSVVQLELNY